MFALSDLFTDPGLESARVAARVYCLLSDAGVGPQLMLDTLEQTGAVLSSPTVGLVVTDLTFTPNDLDVYGTSAQEIVLLTILRDMEFHIDCSQGNSYPSHSACFVYTGFSAKPGEFPYGPNPT